MYFLSVGRSVGTRKNFNGLIEAFLYASNEMPSARLIIKSFPSDSPLQINNLRVINIPFFFSEAQMNALFYCCQAVVSAHHSEGWGLSLSDAFLFGLPTIATRYSGNLQFMTDYNSYLIDADEHPIPAQDTCDLFTTDMKWATPRQAALSETFVRVCDGLSGSDLRMKVSEAKETTAEFSEQIIAELLYSRVEAVIRVLR